jgi:putative inorganic carbon (HCO3(-)) transporter
VVVALEFRHVQLSWRSRRLLKLVAGGYAIGIPFGVLFSPAAAAFALFAYGTAVGCFVIGYREGGERGPLSLPLVLMAATPFLALYAFAQYYLPLPEWDHVWFETVDIVTAGSPEEGRIRVWGTLNSPGTFAVILAITAIVFVASRRFSPVRVAALLVVSGALALTFVRSAWIGLAMAILVTVVVTRGVATRRLGAVALMFALLGPMAFGGSTGAALGDRVATLGGLGQDDSAEERVATPVQTLPPVLRLPLGAGLGQAGESARLLAWGGLRYIDNGYYGLLVQLGPFGFALVVSALAMTVLAAWRNAWHRPTPTDVMAVAILAFLAVMLLAGDHLYGVGGMIFWYTGGLAMRRSERAFT